MLWNFFTAGVIDWLMTLLWSLPIPVEIWEWLFC